MLWRNLRYILRHKWFVFLAACRLGVPWLGLIHDLSKFHPVEFMPYARSFFGSWPSEDDANRLLHIGVVIRWTDWKVRQAFDYAWLHHQRRNPHHWQYWWLKFDDPGKRVLEMPERYAREMVADWIGAGRAQGKGINGTVAWYMGQRHNITLHPRTRALVEFLLGVHSDLIDGDQIAFHEFERLVAKDRRL